MNKKRTMLNVLLLTAALTSSVLSGEWKADIVTRVDALVSSCVVIPCSFRHPKEKLPASRLHAVWHRLQNHDDKIYAEDEVDVIDSFKGRTRLLGNLGQNNCTLEINDVKDHHNGPFCLEMEITETQSSKPDKYDFTNDCVELIMQTDPQKPTVVNLKTAVQHVPHSVTCSVVHTCPSRPPRLTWSRDTPGGVTEIHKHMHLGYWELLSILTFIPEEADDHTEITCTAHFNGTAPSSTTLKFYVKRTENYHHIIIPVVVGVCTAVIFGVICIFMVKKYKRRITELQSQDGSMWNRLSRLSRRFHSGHSGPSRAHQRREEVPNNANSKPAHADQKVSKARFPSPKSLTKSSHGHRQDVHFNNFNNDNDNDNDDYENTADLNVYGNI